jgi:eukaryotic-like serine/threonine-protein kinase
MTPSADFEDSLFGVVLQDSYRIVGLLGEGGMGAVYDAMQIRLNKRVAIKVMARDLASNTEALNRFHREAMITSGLGHPHIVQVFDFSTTPHGQPFLAMEFLDGEDLDRRIARVGHLTPEQTVHIVKQVASALAATHAQQIVHRDLKPANIYLLKVAGEDDFVKVLDFGISKIRASSTKITKAAALIGTPDYMSPEQAMGESDDVDDRTDQWALACIAWECLSGRAPFTADSVPSMLFQVVHRDPPSLAAAVSGLPEGVEVVLRRALSKNKAERFPTVVEFAQALETAIASKAVPVQVPAEVTAKVKRDETATYPSAEAGERGVRPSTTFSHTAGESEGDKPHPGRPTWQWAVAATGVAGVALLAILVLRPSSKRPPAQSASAVPAQAAPVPTPVAPAPVAPAPVPAPSAPAAAAVPTPGEPSAVPSPAPVAAEPAPPPAGAVPVPTPAAASPAAQPAAPAATEAKAAAPELPPDNQPSTSDAENKLRAKKVAPAPTVRSKTKSAQPEHRLIKEL